MPTSLRMISRPSKEYTGAAGSCAMVGDTTIAIIADSAILARRGMADSPNSGAVPISARMRKKGHRNAASQP
ncbi:hypothetical protein D3C81_1018190 [compost metagenome]